MEIPYLEYFGLDEKPFGLTPDIRFFFESASDREAVNFLNFFLAQKEGFAVIYGDVGMGKTMLSRTYLELLDKNVFNTAIILNPIMDETEFLRELLKELGILSESTDTTKKEMFDTLRDFLLEEYKKQKTTVVLVDEAQLLSDDMFEFIRIISNFETEQEKLVHIILFGQQELVEKLKQSHLRNLSQRITVIYRIKPLSHAEVTSYISHRLSKAGSKGFLLFKDGAIKMIHTASAGCPRLINVICDRCLLLLYTRSENTVNENIVNEVLNEESISTLLKFKRKKKFIGIPYIIAAAAAVVILVLYLTGLFPLDSMLRSAMPLK